MGKMIMNGVSYGINANSTIYGAFIDTSRIIKNTTTVSSTTTYTATEDCIVAVTYSATSSSASSVKINGVVVFNSGGSTLTSSGMLCLKKGDIMTFIPAGAYNYYTVYGLLYNAGETTNTVIPNPQAVPRDTLDSISIGGMVYDVGSKYGAFINTNRIIQPVVTVQGSTPVEYTATEDCGVVYTVTESGSNQSMVYINDVMVKLDTGKTDVDWLYLRKGDSLRITGNSAKNYTVLGLIQGTNNIFAPQIYSLEERMIGAWIDNKPLYAITMYTTQQVTLRNDQWTTVPWVNEPQNMNIETLVHAEMDGTVPNSSRSVRFQWVDGHIKGASIIQDLFPPTSLPINCTFYYTKTTDVAGSGSYNTLGVPTKHYSTTEQVIGSVEDENGIAKPLYERMWIGTIPSYTSSAYGCILGTMPNDYDEIIDIKGSLKGTVKAYGTVNGLDINGWRGNLHINTSNQILLFAENSTDVVNLIGGKYRVIIQYTKITD